MQDIYNVQSFWIKMDSDFEIFKKVWIVAGPYVWLVKYCFGLEQLVILRDLKQILLRAKTDFESF